MHLKPTLALAFLSMLFPGYLVPSALAGDRGLSARPTVSVVAPAEGSTLSGTVRVNARCIGAVPCTQVRYYVDGVEPAYDGSASDWSEEWDTRSVGDGEHTIHAKGRDAAGNVATSAPVRFTVKNGVAPSPSASIVWSADHATGDMSQWPKATPKWDSGRCTFHGVSRDRARSGSYSMKLTLDTSARKAGCRQARNEEIQTGGTYYYSAWYYLPRPVTPLNGHWNMFQFKSKEPTGRRRSDPMWVIDFAGRPLRPRLGWKGGNYGLARPKATDGVAEKFYPRR